MLGLKLNHVSKRGPWSGPLQLHWTPTKKEQISKHVLHEVPDSKYIRSGLVKIHVADTSWREMRRETAKRMTSKQCSWLFVSLWRTTWSKPLRNAHVHTRIQQDTHNCLYKLTQETPTVLEQQHHFWPLKNFSRNSRYFMKWNIAHLWWDSNPRPLDYMPSTLTAVLWECDTLQFSVWDFGSGDDIYMYIYIYIYVCVCVCVSVCVVCVCL